MIAIVCTRESLNMYHLNIDKEKCYFMREMNVFRMFSNAFQYHDLNEPSFRRENYQSPSKLVVHVEEILKKKTCDWTNGIAR